METIPDSKTEIPEDMLFKILIAISLAGESPGFYIEFIDGKAYWKKDK